MVSPFDAAFNATAAPLLDQQFGVAVVLRRGVGNVTDSFTASFSVIQDEVFQDEDALGTQAHRRQWWLPVADCVFGSATIEPRQGDELVSGDERHQITPDGTRPAVELDPGGNYWIVRTKRIAR